MTTTAHAVNAAAQAATVLREIAGSYRDPRNPEALILRAAATIAVERARELRHD